MGVFFYLLNVILDHTVGLVVEKWQKCEYRLMVSKTIQKTTGPYVWAVRCCISKVSCGAIVSTSDENNPEFGKKYNRLYGGYFCAGL